jgi:transposase
LARKYPLAGRRSAPTTDSATWWPAQQGLDRANWTHEELAEQLYRTHGIRSSCSAVQRLCRKIDVRLYRPTYRYLRGDPAKQQKTREDLAKLKRGPKRLSSSC